MQLILREIWNKDRRGFLRILLLNIAVSLTGGIGIVMLIPMLDLLDVPAGATGLLAAVLAPFEQIPYTQRAALLIGIYMALVVSKGILQRTLEIQENTFLENYSFELRARLYRAVLGTSWEKLVSKKRTDTIDLFTSQCGQAGYGVSSVIHLLSSFVSALIQLAVAIWMSVPVTLIVLAVGCGMLLIFRPMLKKSRSYGEELIKINRSFYSELLNQLSSVKEVRTYGVQKEHAARFFRISEDFRAAHLKFTRLRATPQFFYSVAAAAMISLVFFVSMTLMGGETARLMVLVYIFSRLWPVFSSLQSQLQGIQSVVPAYETIAEALSSMQSDSDCEDETGETLSFQKEIVFQGVRFHYQSSDKEILSGVDFALPRGSVTALMGRSGAGKTTIADLLLGLLRPSAGEILVDGVPLENKNIRAWRTKIGYVPQEPLILNASVRENLSRFHPDATEAEMTDALQKSLAAGFVNALPQGLDTLLGDQGIRLSGGERQRIVLARVLMGKPRLIILDEATSALDYESERDIREAIYALRDETTVLIIAHRLATIRAAERAIVLENGVIAEAGTLAELLKNPNGYLAKMLMVE